MWNPGSQIQQATDQKYINFLNIFLIYYQLSMLKITEILTFMISQILHTTTIYMAIDLDCVRTWT